MIPKRIRGLSKTLFFAALVAVGPFAVVVADDRILSMEVEKAHGSGLVPLTFDRMAANAGKVARDKNNNNDVSCPLTFARSGDIIEHQTLPKEITTRAQLDIIALLPVDVFVMDQLSVCGPYENNPLVVGCERPGPILVEAGSDAYLTLIHEAGHEAGLGHATTPAVCQSPATAPLDKYNNIMFCNRHVERTLMTQNDCTKLKNTPDFTADQPDLEGAGGPEPASNQVEPQLPTYSPIQRLLMSLFGETANFAAIAALSDEELDGVRAEIYNDDPRFWEPAAYVLGIRGTERDLEALIALAHRAANIESPEGFRARTAVPEAIGMYLSYNRDVAAPDWVRSFLLENVAPENVRVLSQGEDEPTLLAQRYAQGAALSGDIELAQGAIDLLSARSFSAEITNSVAARAIAAQNATPEQIFNTDMPAFENPQLELRNRVQLQQIDSNLIDTLRDNGLTFANSALIVDFGVQQLNPGLQDLQVLDQRVLELNQQVLMAPVQ